MYSESDLLDYGRHLYQTYDFKSLGGDAVPLSSDLRDAIEEYLKTHDLSTAEQDTDAAASQFIEESGLKSSVDEFLSTPTSDRMADPITAGVVGLAFAVWLIAQTTVRLEIDYDSATKSKKIHLEVRKGKASASSFAALLKALLKLPWP